jgi:hypothetical protein
MADRRESAARRDEILCALARQMPPERGDSPRGVARWLKDREKLGFRGLDATIPDNDERLAFEHWARTSSEDNLAKRVQRAFRAEQAARKPAKPPVEPLPPLVWPLGMRQRKERNPSYKLPWLLADRGGSEKVFLQSLAAQTLLDVAVVLEGARVGYLPALRPGEFLELNWDQNPAVEKIVTWGGFREAILSQPRNREAVRSMEGVHHKDPDFAEFAKSLTDFARATVVEVEKVMPPSYEAWKGAERRFRLSVTYTLENGNAPGKLEGILSFAMERLWFGFRDSRGNQTLIR